MKTFFLVILPLVAIALSASAEAYDIPHTANINWKCEEGAGNLDNPAPYLHIEGKFETQPSREFSDSEKQKMKITVFEDGESQVLDSDDYDLEWKSDGRFADIEITYGATKYRIGNTGGRAILISITKPGRIFGTSTVTGSCF